MPRALQHRAKKALIRRRLQKREAAKRQRPDSTDRELGSPPQRPRHKEPTDSNGNGDDAMYADIPEFDEADIAGADDGDDWEPITSATDFDDFELARALIDVVNEEDHVVYPDPETDEYQLADDGPLQQELQELAEYQYAADTIESHVDEAEGIAAADEHEEEVLDTIAVAAPWDTAGQYQTSEPEDPFAASQPVEQHRKAHDLSEFALGLGLYCIIHSVSRKQYSTLLQLLKLLGHSDKISRLPDSLDTLKRHVRESMPRVSTCVWSKTCR
jgi:DnaJ-domain-containing protein 1